MDRCWIVDLISFTDESDFVSLSNVLVTIPSGSDTASINVTIRGDILPEEDEQFTLIISAVNPRDRVVSPMQATVTILNDDTSEIWHSFSVCD